MEKKALLTAAFISMLLLSAVAGAMSVNLATANPAPLFPLPWDEPVTTPTTIVVRSPVQKQTYNSTEVWLNFSIVVKPESVFENVTSVYYVVDSGERQNITVYDIDSLFYPSSRTLNFSSKLTLTEGVHNVTVRLEADSYYVLYVVGQGFTLPSVAMHVESETLSFTVNTLPEISVLLMRNETYSMPDVPLSFFVNEPVSCICYSLDGQENVTIAGNTTLTELANGDHNLTVYATDEAGNMGASETIWFSVAESFPTALVAVVSVATIVVVGVGLIVYFKKRK